MLYPQTNRIRQSLEISGIWKFRADPEQRGEQEGWYRGFDSGVEIAVPGSWNEQLEELGLLHYVGAAWHQRSVFVPAECADRRLVLRIGSADYSSKVWANGQFVGEHQGGFLPFEFDITSVIQPGAEALITIKVDNQLSRDTIPQGICFEDYVNENRLRDETYPPARFDFSPFGGIHRPVWIYTTPASFLRNVMVDTSIISGSRGRVQVNVFTERADGMKVDGTLEGDGQVIVQHGRVTDGTTRLVFEIENCRYWSPKNPFLHTLDLALTNEDGVLDMYRMSVGVREVKIDGHKLFLNGEEIYLKGFGRHEDFTVVGKGLSLPVLVKDFNLMRWIHANSFRTSHYPYAEEVLDMADRNGFLVIDEVPAVSLDLRYANDRMIRNHKQFIADLIERDYNHPSVVMWSLGNEPNLVGDEGYVKGSGRNYWNDVFSFARSLDDHRPFTVPNCLRAGSDDPVFEFSDILTINRYYGWYEYPGRLEFALQQLEKEMDELHKKFKKPIMMTEFGADAIPGLHSASDQLFTEEYQEKMIRMYISLVRSKPYIIGEHVWGFADFRTPQHFRRVMFNMKGVFTRARQPKAAAFALRNLWKEQDSSQ